MKIEEHQYDKAIKSAYQSGYDAGRAETTPTGRKMLEKAIEKLQTSIHFMKVIGIDNSLVLINAMDALAYLKEAQPTGEEEKCPKCDGEGKYEVYMGQTHSMFEKCQKCNGIGKVRK